jgi:GNAT superfamily N-acetyltransferase
MIDSFETRGARDSYLLTKAFQLRYEVFSEEMQDHRYANHKSREWRDEDDIQASTILVAVDSSENVIATARLTPLPLHEFIGHEAYGFDKLAALLEMRVDDLRLVVARLDRVVVSKLWRGRRVINKLISDLEQIALERGFTIIVGLVGVGNRRSIVMFGSLGYKEYPVVAEYRGFTAQMLYKKLLEPMGLASENLYEDIS